MTAGSPAPAPSPTRPLPDLKSLDAADAPGAGGVKWVLGSTLSSSAAYAGSAERKLGLKPVLAFRVGRWMVSTSSARRLGDMPLAGGISTTVVRSDRWRLGLGLRLTQGRSSSDAALLAGLPDVPRSLALRAAASVTLAPQWQLTAHLQQDIQHAQGLHAGLALGTSRPLPGSWQMDIGGGLNWANARAQNTFYGVSTTQALPGRPAWAPGAGWDEWHWGVGLSRPLTRHWRFMANVGQTTLLGDTARSPLTQQRTDTVAQVTLAYVGW